MEGAMSTIALDRVTVHPSRQLRWSQVKQYLVEWCHRARSRNELMDLSDRCLQDIGMPRRQFSQKAAGSLLYEDKRVIN
jgi:uncharacterized protein YjiS (DUF1127 family)